MILSALIEAQPAGKTPACSTGNPAEGGSAEIRCTGLTAEQAAQIRNLPALLNRLLQSKNRLDLQAALETCAATKLPERTYSFDGGLVRVNDGSVQTATAQKPPEAFSRMQELERGEQWQALIELCTQQIALMPEWLTPQLFEGIALAKLGRRTEAVRLLEYVRDHAAGDPAYARAGALLRQLGE
jgi:hypothetical protein